VEILHLGSDFSFITETSVPAYWKIIFCHLKVKGALLYFFSEDGVTIIIMDE